ncbi:MAG: hypothetical protein HND53_00240 [Proteobacteria bacterium]|nr:hypothetical protein [Pseudomonadota bacterium]
MGKSIKIWSLLLFIILPSILFAEQNNKVNKEKTILDVLAERTETMNESLKKYTVADLKEVFSNSNDNNESEDEVPLRDPFNLSDKMGMQTPGGSVGPTSFLPSFDQKKIPKLKLKGVINPDANSPKELLALLEVNSKEVYMVRVGDELSYDPTNPSAAMKIVTISRLSVTVQVGSLGNVLIVR